MAVHLDLALTSVGEPDRVYTQPNDPSIVYELAVDPSWREHTQKGDASTVTGPHWSSSSGP